MKKRKATAPPIISKASVAKHQKVEILRYDPADHADETTTVAGDSCIESEIGERDGFVVMALTRHRELVCELVATQGALARSESAYTSAILRINLPKDSTKPEAARLGKAVAESAVGEVAFEASRIWTCFRLCSRRNAVADMLKASEKSEKVALQELITHEMQMTQLGLLARFNSSSKECRICRDDVLPGTAVLLGCSHGFYCTQCVTKTVQARLDDGIAGYVPCPDCGLAIPENYLTEILPQKTMQCLAQRTLEQKALSAGSGTIQRACPTPNCAMRQAIKVGCCGMDICPKCTKESCWLCGAQPFHDGRTCEQHATRERSRGHRTDDDSFQAWLEATGTRQCPKCQMALSKEKLENQTQQRSECHKMLCRNCGTRFCFKCLAVLTDKFTCGCSKNRHGFIDPHTGTHINHLKPGSSERSKKQARNK